MWYLRKEPLSNYWVEVRSHFIPVTLISQFRTTPEELCVGSQRIQPAPTTFRVLVPSLHSMGRLVVSVKESKKYSLLRLILTSFWSPLQTRVIPVSLRWNCNPLTQESYLGHALLLFGKLLWKFLLALDESTASLPFLHLSSPAIWFYHLCKTCDGRG